MKIQSSQVYLGSQQSSLRRQLQQADVRVQSAQNPQVQLQPNESRPLPTGNGDLTINGVRIRAASGIAVSELTAVNQLEVQRQESQQAASLSRVTQIDAGTQVLLSHFNLLESISSISVDQRLQISTGNVSDTPVQLASADAIQIASINTFEQTDRLTTEALGSVITEDGRQIDFLMQLDFERTSTITQQELLQRQNLNFIDPLVINLNGDAPTLADATFEFDLDADGEIETINKTAAGTGFIAFDKNQNGVIDDGSELFGPQTGSGFTELAQYDEDGNGWIDENDSAYAQLSFMDFTADGEQRLRSLKDVEVGAIYLGSTQSQWDLEDSAGNLQAQMQRSGVALREDGKALAVQEIYYASEMEKFNTPTFSISQSTDDPSMPEFSATDMDRLDAVSQEVQAQNTNMASADSASAAASSTSETSSTTANGSRDFSIPKAVEHLRWLDDEPLIQEDDMEESKLEYLRELVQDLRDQREEKLKNESKLEAYRFFENLSDV